MAEWVRVAALADCPEGSLLGVRIGSEPVVIVNAEGDLYALEDQCSHQDFPLSAGELEGTRIECTFHGAKFDVCTGRAVQLPAIRPVRTFEVEVRDDDIYVRVG